jgi:hypothetical protein
MIGDTTLSTPPAPQAQADAPLIVARINAAVEVLGQPVRVDDSEYAKLRTAAMDFLENEWRVATNPYAGERQ